MALTEPRHVEATPATLREMYERMALIRAFEEATVKSFADGHIPGFVHLYVGEEAVAVGVCTHLTDDDFITSTHRGHGHCIAKGVEIEGMAAELMGRRTGLCAGKGGSMHVADFEKGMLGANGIVGGGSPLACGAALTAKTHGTGAVAVCFFGDGAANQGTFHESLNLAVDLEAAGRVRLREQRLRRGDAVQLPLLDTDDVANRASRVRHSRSGRRRPRRARRL